MSVSSEYLQESLGKDSFFKRLGVYDWLWAAVVVAGALFAHYHYAGMLKGYNLAILYGTAAITVLVGWNWKPFRPFGIVVAALALFAIWLYGGSLARGEHEFFLRFMLSSQTATMWMSVLFVMAMFAYYSGLIARSEFALKVGTALTWCAAAMGLVGMLVRWRESYLMGPDIGHIPVSSLYDVFLLFSVMTALLYLFYERRIGNRSIGGFVLTVISAAVAFLLWYGYDRGANHIQPLVPALQSYWLKIHVPANFVGYGCFALAAMAGVGYLFADTKPGSAMATRMPPKEQLDDLMYKTVALGFIFFTIATILGAIWAAQAWGGYWSWDPKETWALIVWLNYAAWLHLRLTKGWRGRPLAWWAVVGLFVTLFAFLGVNMFLSGLHSYGHL